MLTAKEVNSLVKEIMEMASLDLNPQAIKMIEDESSVPEGAVWPRRDLGKHIALCQGMAMTKREGKTVYMTKHDHWCWNPIVGLGHVKCEPGMDSFEEICRNLGIADPEAAREFFAAFPKLEHNKYKGTLMAPAQSCDFVPDVILFNCSNNFQLRFFIWGIKSQTGKMLDNPFDAIDSCIHTIVEPMQTGEYRIAIPDPGDQERALAQKDEIILAVPIERLEELVRGCKMIDGIGAGYHGMKPEMLFDFPRPPFYNRLYEIWGLDQGEIWQH
ncbi:MAG: DUF169 domain-containing protein [Oscillospiraceae bacterium]|nr:DUF169 domain-containing protein [Oscillospiraceae bacterium]